MDENSNSASSQSSLDYKDAASQSSQKSKHKHPDQMKQSDRNQQLKEDKNVFLTTIQRQIAPPDLVKESHDQLNFYIEDLDKKIDGVIERHETEFLTAYRNHMTKIRKELAEMKKRQDEQEKSFHANDRIQGLEKQLSWFREESLKLYNKLEQKDKENDLLRGKIDDFKKEKIFLEGQVKVLLKKNKYLEVKVVNLQNNTSSNTQIQEISQSQQNNMGQYPVSQGGQCQQPYVSKGGQYSLPQSTRYLRTRTATQDQPQQNTDFYTDDLSINGQIVANIFKKNMSNINTMSKEITYYLNTLEQRKDKQLKTMKEKLEKIISEKLKLNFVRSDLEDFFLECVETVRRQIVKRKHQHKDCNNMNYYLNEIKDYNIFRMEDKMKILELLVSHEKLLIYIYQKIFPSQFNTFLQTAIEKESQRPPHPQTAQSNDYDQNQNQYEQDDQNNINFGNLQQIQKRNLNQSYDGGAQKKSKNQILDKVIVKKGKLLFRQI